MTTIPNESASRSSVLTWLSFALALVAVAGSLALSMALKLKACPLCFYQRTFVMGVVGVLGVGLLFRSLRTSSLSLLALPLAVGGAGVAAFHVYLEMTGKMECPLGLGGLGTAPQQSVAIFVLLVIALLVDAALALPGAAKAMLLLPVCLGGLFTVGAIASSSPPCPVVDYSKPLDGCRPPEPARK